MSRVIYVTAKVRGGFSLSFPAALATFGVVSLLLGRAGSRDRCGRWSGSRGERRRGSGTEIVADHPAGQKGQVRSVAPIVFVVRGYDDAATGNLAAHV